MHYNAKITMVVKQRLLLFRQMFIRLKKSKRLTNNAMKSLISSVVERYDFSGVYITEGSIKLLCQRCKYLKELDLAGCDYLVTDNIVRLLAKVCIWP